MKIKNSCFPVKFSANLKFLREKMGKSAAELAQDLGLQEIRVVAFEQGKAEPDHFTLIKIGQYFNVSLQAMIEADLEHPFQTFTNTCGSLSYQEYHTFLERTSQTQLMYEELLTHNKGFNSPYHEDLSLKKEIKQLRNILKVILESNWNLIKTLKNHYHSTYDA